MQLVIEDLYMNSRFLARLLVVLSLCTPPGLLAQDQAAPTDVPATAETMRGLLESLNEALTLTSEESAQDLEESKRDVAYLLESIAERLAGLDHANLASSTTFQAYSSSIARAAEDIRTDPLAKRQALRDQLNRVIGLCSSCHTLLPAEGAKSGLTWRSPERTVADRGHAASFDR